MEAAFDKHGGILGGFIVRRELDSQVA
jgi:hypothetical protein